MNKDIILFVNAIRPSTFEALSIFEKKTGRTFTPMVIVDERISEAIKARNGQLLNDHKYLTVKANFDSAISIRNALNPYMDRIFSVTSQYENSMLELKKLIPYFSYSSMPTESSIDWATEKKLMRELMESHDKALVPNYIEINDAKILTIDEIESRLSYPMVVKPSGLEGSLLVSLVNNRTELINTIKKTFKEMQDAYNVWIKRQSPRLLVEEFMDGDMYSIDTYISVDGTCKHLPIVKVLTGRKVGFDDFFGYMRISPSGLTKEEVAAAYKVADASCKALGLKSITAHIEIMKLGKEWKVIELGPRIGGYRHEMYQMSYGINHIVNDILNRAGEAVEVYTEPISNVAVFNIYARNEGTIEEILGLDKVKLLKSFSSVREVLKVGDEANFAKNNGDQVLDIVMSNVDAEELYKDIKTMESTISINVNSKIVSLKPLTSK